MSEALRNWARRHMPAPLWVAVRRAASYLRRLGTWRHVLSEVSGATMHDQQVLKASARRAFATALRNLDDWQDPVLIEAADVAVNGVGRFHVRPYCDDLYHVTPAREPAILRVIQTRLAPGDLFVDAGANIGFYSIAASSRVGPEGQILAIEMMPDTAAILREHVRLNGGRNIQVVEQALSDQAHKSIEATVESGKFGQASIARPAETSASVRRVTVQTTTLDMLLEGEQRPIALIKLDLEGAELDALRGATATLERTQAIIFEQLGESRDVEQLLVQAGFAVRPLDGSNCLAARPSS